MLSSLALSIRSWRKSDRTYLQPDIRYLTYYQGQISGRFIIRLAPNFIKGFGFGLSWPGSGSDRVLALLSYNIRTLSNRHWKKSLIQERFPLFMSRPDMNSIFFSMRIRPVLYKNRIRNPGFLTFPDRVEFQQDQESKVRGQWLSLLLLTRAGSSLGRSWYLY